jgi:hypothetical protein
MQVFNDACIVFCIGAIDIWYGRKSEPDREYASLLRALKAKYNDKYKAKQSRHLSVPSLKHAQMIAGLLVVTKQL